MRQATTSLTCKRVPGDGAATHAATAARATLLTAIGFALLLAAALALTGGAGWHRGMLWGLGGYAAFVLAPSIGLPLRRASPACPKRHSRHASCGGSAP